jgi:NAD(P)-dependent dehydrogenase (short-subunit alcohol dehydrogenase family)
MARLLEGKVAIITGAGRGIGREEALLMAKQGAKIVVNDLGAHFDGSGADQSPAQQVVSEIKAAGGEAVANGDSVSDFKAAKRIVQCAIDTFGKLNIVINNAGILRDRMIFNMGEEDWDAVIGVHLKGAFNMSRHACEYWREEHKKGNVLNGRIVNTSSDAGLLGNVGQTNYGAAKAAVALMATVMDAEMQKYGVCCNAIAPVARTRVTVDPTPSTAAFMSKKDEEGKRKKKSSSVSNAKKKTSRK